MNGGLRSFSPNRTILKVIKKLGKISLWFLGVIVFLGLTAYITIQTYAAQTWLAQRAAAWFSAKVHARVEIKKVSIDFFSRVGIEGIYVEDLHQDTLAYIDKLVVDISGFDREKQHVKLETITLENSKLDVVYYKHDTDLNFQFIKDALRTKRDTTKKDSTGWQVDFGDLYLKNFALVYRDERDSSGSRGIDFANLQCSGIDGHVRGLKIEDDTISGKIIELSAKERSGFVIRKLTGDARVSPVSLKLDNMVLLTNASDIRTNLLLTYEHWDDYNHFVHKVKMNADFDRTELQLRDLGYFAPDLKGFDQKVYLSGNISGKVDGLKGKNIDVIFGHDTHFAGDFSFKGLPDIDETFMTINIRELTTTKKELEEIPIPPYDSTRYLRLSANMALLGKVKYKGKLTGYYYDFVSDGIVTTALGTLGTNLQLNQNTENGDISYSGKLWSNAFNIGKLISVSELGEVTLNTDIVGNGVKLSTMKANLKNCTVSSIQYKGYTYRNIEVDDGSLSKRHFHGKAKIKDENVDMGFTGDIDFSNDPVKMHFLAQVNQADLVALHFVDSRKHITIATNAEVDISGDDIDKMTGYIHLKNTAYIQGKDFYNVEDLLFSAGGDERLREFSLESDLANAWIKGRIRLSDLGLAFTNMLNYYIPATTVKARTRTRQVSEDFAYNVTLKNFDPVAHLIVPSLSFAPGTNFTGVFDSQKNNFVVTGKSEKIKLGGTQILGWDLQASGTGNHYSFNTNCTRYVIADTIWADNPSITSVTGNDTMSFTLGWHNTSGRANYGDLRGEVDFTRYPGITFRFKPSSVMVNDSLWQLKPGNSISIDSSHIAVSNIFFGNGNQSISLHGAVSEKKDEKLFIGLENFNIANLNVLTQPRGYELKGTITGTGDFSNLYDTTGFKFSSNFDISNVFVNKEEVGTGWVICKYDKNKEAISVNSSFKRGGLPFITLNGYYYPARQKESLDLEAMVSDFKTTLIEPLAADICSPLKGKMTANMKIRGEPDHLLLSGVADVQIDTVRLNYMNTVYSAKGLVHIEDNSFAMENLEVLDVNNNSAFVTGHVYHNNFREWQLDLDIRASKFCMLNTSLLDNDLYYGKVFATGIVNIFGYLDNIQIDASVKTDKVNVPGKGIEYSHFYLPLSGPSEASDNSFITFVRKDSVNRKDDDVRTNLNGLTLNLQLEATTDAEAQIIFDEKVGDVIKAKGEGNLLMSINTNGNFSMFGEYEIAQGDYLFTLQNLVNKHFEIQKGGTIKWSGDPYNAEINMNAIYVAKAALKPFFPEDSTQLYKKRVRTECVMQLTGALMSPDINFDIELPTVDANTSQTVKSYITTQQEMNQQIFTLLLLNSFTTPEALKTAGTSGFDGGQAVGVTSSELLSNQLSNMLSQISKSIDLGVNYRPGDNISKDEVEFLLSKQFFNDKLTIDGSVGNNTNTTSQNASSVVGDISMDYKLTDDGKVRVKAYNKTNDNLILNPDAQYKQGIGLFYREEFDTIGELYRRYLDRLQRKKENQPNP
jgi:hypothetical protein